MSAVFSAGHDRGELFHRRTPRIHRDFVASWQLKSAAKVVKAR